MNGSAGRPAFVDLSPDPTLREIPGRTEKELGVHRQVFAVADRAPRVVAVRGGGRELCYGELRDQAERLRARLAASGCGPGDRIAVACQPSADMIVALLGVLDLGAAYVPVDLTLPAARIEALLGDAGVAAVVADRLGCAVVSQALQGKLDTEPAPGDGLAVHRVHASAGTGPTPGAAYVIYTSGTTGEPKGVVVGHAQLSASTGARAMVYPGPATFLLVSPLAFDSSVAGIWGTLTTGGRLVVASADEVRDVEALVELIAREGVTRTLCIPSLYEQILDAAERRGTDLSTVDTVVVAGEPLPDRLLRRHFAVHRAGVALVNEYGPTEATVWASYRRYTEPAPVTIGGPAPGARLYVLDEHGRPVGPGVEGELYVGGAGVGWGYLGRPGATARAFLSDPFAPDPAARMFRTGDVVRWRDDGELCFVGRRDHQVKIRGHRVELGAVEAELRRAPQVRDVVVLPDAAGTRLTAFVTISDTVSEAVLREHLAARLPAVMVPASIRTVPRFPLTPNGKVDRSGLAEAIRSAPENGNGTNGRARAAGRNGGTAAGVRAAWAEILKISTVPADVNFFELGGHSLAMFQLQDALEQHTGTRPSIVALFRHTTVAEQVSYIESQVDNPALATPTRARAVAIRAARMRRAAGGDGA